MNIPVEFPEGIRNVPAVILGRNSLGAAPAVLAVPRAVPGFTLRKIEGRGWMAS